MKNEELITVIIPIYNVEDYLKRCIDSVINQTYRNLEIFLVDDGSTDTCAEICDWYAQIDNRIEVIHKRNGGLSDARNSAIDRVKGDYIIFVDSDDFVSKFYIENLYNALIKSDADMSSSWFVDFEIEEDFICNNNIDKSLKVYDKQTYLEKMLYQDSVETSAWGKLYKKSIFLDLRYPKGKLYEDILVTYEVIKRCDRIAVISNVDYYYFQRKSSIQNQTFNMRKLDAIEHMTQLKEKVLMDFPKLSDAANCRYFSTLCNIMFQINDMQYIDIRKELWREITSIRKRILFNKKARKKARIAAFLSYFGFFFMKKIYYLHK